MSHPKRLGAEMEDMEKDITKLQALDDIMLVSSAVLHANPGLQSRIEVAMSAIEGLLVGWGYHQRVAIYAALVLGISEPHREEYRSLAGMIRASVEDVRAVDAAKVAAAMNAEERP